MPDTTVDFWDVDGVSLNTYVQNLDSWGGSREAPPPLRGSDLLIPYSYGKKFVPKTPDARPLSLVGWVTAERAGVESEANLKQNWRDLRKLLWRPTEEFALTRRWRDAAGTSMVATGLAQFRSGLEPAVSNQMLRFEAQLEMADPFFYGPEFSQPILARSTYELITKPGDWGSKKVFIDLVGPLTGITILSISGNLGNPNLVNESSLSYPDIATGTTVTIDVENFKATETTAGVTTKTSGKVTHKYSPLWFQLGKTKGTQGPRWRVAATGTGTATLRYKPAYH